MFNCGYDFLSFYPDNSDIELRRSSAPPSCSDPKRKKATAGNNV